MKCNLFIQFLYFFSMNYLFAGKIDDIYTAY